MAADAKKASVKLKKPIMYHVAVFASKTQKQ